MRSSAHPHFPAPEDGLDVAYEEEGLDLRRYWSVITKYKRGILGIVIAVTLLATLIVSSMQPIYRSTATLMIGESRSPVPGGSADEGYRNRWAAQEMLNSQVEILKSRQLAKATLQQLKLNEHPEFDPLEEKKQRSPSRFQANWRKWLPDSFVALWDDTPLGQGREDEIRQERLLAWLESNLTVQLMRDTQLVTISFESPDPKLAALVVNTVADTYIESDMQRRLDSRRKASEWLLEQLEDLREKISESERELQRYREDVGLADVQGLQSIYASELKDLIQKVSEVRRQRAEAKTLYEQVERLRSSADRTLRSVPAVLQHPLIQSLKQNETEAERSISELAKRYGPAHPQMIAAQSRLKAVQAEMGEAIGQIAEGVQKAYQVALANEQGMERELRRLEAKVVGLNRKEFKLRALEREVASRRETYNLFLIRFNETNAASNDTISVAAQVVDPAEASSVPVKPRKARTITIALMLSLVGGIGTAFLTDHLDNTVKSAEDVENKLGLPLLGMLEKASKNSQALSSLTSGKALLEHPNSALSEAFRTIRTGVALSSVDKPYRKILVTSSVPGEGKTTVSVNLAMAFGQVGKVLLIDTDLRRSDLAGILRVSSGAPGVTELLVNEAGFADCIHRFEEARIDLLPAGQQSSNPLELISSSRFASLLHDLSGKYDRIIMDSAPVHSVSDALVLGTLSDAVLYIIKADETPYKVATRGITALQQTGVAIVGVILNQFAIRNINKYGYHGGYYYAPAGYGDKGDGREPPRRNKQHVVEIASVPRTTGVKNPARGELLRERNAEVSRELFSGLRKRRT